MNEEDIYSLIMQDRDRILRAFIAETGLLPSQCIQICRVLPDGSHIWMIRKITEEEKIKLGALPI